MIYYHLAKISDTQSKQQKDIQPISPVEDFPNVTFKWYTTEDRYPNQQHEAKLGQYIRLSHLRKHKQYMYTASELWREPERNDCESFTLDDKHQGKEQWFIGQQTSGTLQQRRTQMGQQQTAARYANCKLRVDDAKSARKSKTLKTMSQQ